MCLLFIQGLTGLLKNVESCGALKGVAGARNCTPRVSHPLFCWWELHFYGVDWCKLSKSNDAWSDTNYTYRNKYIMIKQYR